MAGSTTGKQRRTLSEIMSLPSGSLRVRIYAGIDPLTGKKHHLTEVIPAGKDAENLPLQSWRAHRGPEFPLRHQLHRLAG